MAYVTSNLRQGAVPTHRAEDAMLWDGSDVNGVIQWYLHLAPYGSDLFLFAAPQDVCLITFARDMFSIDEQYGVENELSDRASGASPVSPHFDK